MLIVFIVVYARVSPVSIVVFWGPRRYWLCLGKMLSGSFGSESGVEGGKTGDQNLKRTRVAPGPLLSLLTAKSGV